MGSSPAAYIPLHWPSQWTDPSALDLLKGTRVNCLLFDDSTSAAAVRDAATKTGLITIAADDTGHGVVASGTLSAMPWTNAAPILTITDANWPGVRMQRRGDKDSADSGPTGAPWVDANGWMVQLANAKAPGKRIWLASKPGKNEFATRPASYLLSIAEAAAYGARWPIRFDDGFSLALAARETAAMNQWRRMAKALDFFEEHDGWSQLRADAALGVVSGFTGDDEFLGTEFLNLAARRGLLYRVFDKTRPLAAEGLTALIYLDSEPPSGPLRDALSGFANKGGLLIAPAAAGFKGGSPVAGDVPGYEFHSLGKGRIANPVKPWEDPWLVAAETQMLAGRRSDPVRLYNPGGLGLFVESLPGGSRTVVHLFNYSLNRSGDDKTLAPLGKYASARFITMEDPAPRPLQIVRRTKVNDEVALPRFGVYAAVEFNQ